MGFKATFARALSPVDNEEEEDATANKSSIRESRSSAHFPGAYNHH